MHIEIDSDKLYERRMNGDPKLLCANCFLDECYELGCCKEECECSREHGS